MKSQSWKTPSADRNPLFRNKEYYRIRNEQELDVMCHYNSYVFLRDNFFKRGGAGSLARKVSLFECNVAHVWNSNKFLERPI